MAATVECVRLNDAVVCDGEVFRLAGAAARRRALQGAANGTTEPLDQWGDAHLSAAEYWVDALFVALLVLAAGLFSGLNIGLLALDVSELETIVAAKSGVVSERDQQNAARVLPVVRNTHQLLVTLLLSNCAAMEALPIFLDRIIGGPCLHQGMSIVRRVPVPCPPIRLQSAGSGVSRL